MKRKYQKMLKEAQQKIDRLMPGKTLDEVSKLYEQFYDELMELRKKPGNTWQETLDCMDRYADVLEIADVFPEEGTESWASYRSVIEYMIENEEFLN